MKTKMKAKAIFLATLAVTAFGRPVFSQTTENVLPESGNVGIGTSTPTEKLDVNGNARIGENMTVEGATSMQAAAVAAELKVDGNINYQGATQSSDVNSSVVVMDPTTKILKVMPLSTIHQMQYTLLTCNNNIPTWASGLNKMYPTCDNANVGIGTSTPAFKLDVRGRGNFLEGVRLGSYTTSPNMPIQALVEGERSVNSTAPWIRMSVRNANGTNETRFRVENNGTVYCTQVNVRPPANIPIPDYVFKSDYQLMPLTELHRYVLENSHLPNIPNEKEIRMDGMNLDEMQLKLLEKVEELTLYMIELDAKNKVLMQEIEKLKADAVSK